MRRGRELLAWEMRGPMKMTMAELAMALPLTSMGFALFAYGERRGRAMWTRRDPRSVYGSPYRTSAHVGFEGGRAPFLVRAASLLSFLTLALFVPWMMVSLFIHPADGIANGALPGIAMALLNARRSWTLLSRPPRSWRAMRDSVASLVAIHLALLALGLTHVVINIDDPSRTYDGRLSPLVYDGVALAIAALVPALLMLRASGRAVEAR